LNQNTGRDASHGEDGKGFGVGKIFEKAGLQRDGMTGELEFWGTKNSGHWGGQSVGKK